MIRADSWIDGWGECCDGGARSGQQMINREADGGNFH